MTPPMTVGGFSGARSSETELGRLSWKQEQGTRHS